MDKRRCLLGLAAKVRDHQAAIERRMAEEMAEVLKPAKPRAAQTSAPPPAPLPLPFPRFCHSPPAHAPHWCASAGSSALSPKLRGRCTMLQHGVWWVATRYCRSSAPRPKLPRPPSSRR
jgi:hypothetical protein